jgi:thiamine kinase
MTTPKAPLIAPPQSLVQAVHQTVPTSKGSAWVAMAGGRVNTLWQVDDLVVKCYRADGESPLFPNRPETEVAALTALGPKGLAPKLRAAGPDWIVYDLLPGQLWSGDVQSAAQALRRIHAMPALAGFRQMPIGSAEILHQGAKIAAACKGQLPPPPPDMGVAGGPLHFVHGDAVPGNMIEQNGTVTLIDWQCPGLGDPVDDLAAFLSPAMQYLYGGHRLAHEERSEFLAAFAQDLVARYRLLAPALHWRIAAHCLWRAERGANDYRTALARELESLETLA